MRDGGYMQTPIVYGDELYVCRDNGVLSVFDAKTGQRHYQGRLADGRTGFSASPVASNGRIYFTSEEGDVYVVKAGTAFEQLAVNPLGEVAMATPAISEGTMFFRTRGHLVAVARSSRERPSALAGAARIARISSSGKSSGSAVVATGRLPGLRSSPGTARDRSRSWGSSDR